MTDAYHTRIGEALNHLRDDLDRDGEYPDAEHRAARKFKVKEQDLRKAYDEFTSITHNPEEYL